MNILDQIQDDVENLSFLSTCTSSNDDSLLTEEEDEERKLLNDDVSISSDALTQNYSQTNYDNRIQNLYPECFLCNASYNHGNHKCYIICIEGHSMCKICRYSMKHNNYKTCPLCRQNMFPAPGIVNREITSLLNEFKTKLKLKQEGVNNVEEVGKRNKEASITTTTTLMRKSNQTIGVFGITALPYQRTWKCDECLMRNYYYSDHQSLTSQLLLCCMLCGTQKKKRQRKIPSRLGVSLSSSTSRSSRSDSWDHDEIFMPPPAPPRSRQRYINGSNTNSDMVQNCEDDEISNEDDEDDSCAILIVSIFLGILVYYIIFYLLLIHYPI